MEAGDLIIFTQDIKFNLFNTREIRIMITPHQYVLKHKKDQLTSLHDIGHDHRSLLTDLFRAYGDEIIELKRITK